MKISTNQLKDLMTKHIFLLSEDELKALAFILDIEIRHFEKFKSSSIFTLTHRYSSVIVRCHLNSNCEIGAKAKGKNNSNGLVSYGGCFSFARVVRTFRNFYSCGYELTISSPEKLAVYEKAEWEEIVLLADDIVQSA